jgi:nucleotide-binding universal stress UspA family protein
MDRARNKEAISDGQDEGIAERKSSHLQPRYLVITRSGKLDQVKSITERIGHISNTAVFVFTTDTQMLEDTPVPVQNTHAGARQKILVAVADAAQAAGVTCEVVHVEHEHPYQAIIDTAGSNACDLIVIASHGRHGISAIVSAARPSRCSRIARFRYWFIAETDSKTHKGRFSEAFVDGGQVGRLKMCWFTLTRVRRASAALGLCHNQTVKPQGACSHSLLGAQ